MTIKSGFFNSIGGDRRYNAAFFAEYFASFIGNGVYPNPGTSLQVVANDQFDMTTKVLAGKGWINGYYINNDDDFFTLQHDIADGTLSRIDRIVLRLDFLKRAITIELLKGENATTPIAPILTRNATYHELALADVLISPGMIVITQSAITDTRLDAELCGIVHGTIEQIDLTTLADQYRARFQEEGENFEVEYRYWFEGLQAVLSGDVATNLAGRIDKKIVTTPVIPTNQILGDVWFETNTTPLDNNTGLYLGNMVVSTTAPTDTTVVWAEEEV